ncbi:pseudouridine synthase [Lottiidibacillus patelloidae]|uniref:Pseudouridine synthase n=1 Tax=Lottiidibacillus patelloidae TaxID=2670334 RepID=A0A263BTZ3_9BACI|nr:pseudouridine synthase [Lottiidibacillus patelloidae]OZM57155.1 pseudouridine synthase [Lottiidibacillus patelloidae]
MERLQKVIAQAGVASRRKAEQLIVEGKVKVNGKVIKELGTKVSGNDEVEVDGIPLYKEEHVYFVLYKPTGVISSVQDEKGRKVVTDYLYGVEQRVFPVGRLDYDTSGLLLLTNDGDLANKLMHPKFNVEKKYIAKVEGIPSKEVLLNLTRGIVLGDGKTKPAKTKLISGDRRKNTSIIEITISEGRNRQVRRMFEAIGHPVKKLKREKYGMLNLLGMNPGDVRELKPFEVKQLKQLTVTEKS